MNPVRAKMVKRVDQWPWSSYRATAGSRSCPRWLTTDWVLGHFGSRRKPVQAAYRRFVAEGMHGVSPWHDLRGRMFLGSETFLRQMRARIKGMGTDSEHISQAVLVPSQKSAPSIDGDALAFETDPELPLGRLGRAQRILAGRVVFACQGATDALVAPVF